MLPKLEENQEILPSKRDEALFLCSVSSEIPPSLLSLESVLDTIEATQEFPRHSRLHPRGTPSVLPQLKKSPRFPSSSADIGPFPCFVGKANAAFPLHQRGGSLNLTLERNSKGRATISKDPDVPMHSRYPDFHALLDAQSEDQLRTHLHL